METSIAKSCVIPAQAGIQLIEKTSRSETITWFCPLRGAVFLLDSRLRGNDDAKEALIYSVSSLRGGAADEAIQGWQRRFAVASAAL